MGRNGKDVFVSYAGADRAWAEWAAWHLREAGYSVELNTDWATGDNFVLKMNDAVAKSGRILMLWSPAYFDPKRFTTDEWTSAMSLPPEKRSTLIPVRVAAVDPPVILGPLSYLDAFDLDEERAVQRLLEAVGGRRDKNGRPEFPGTAKRKPRSESGPRLPGALPGVWKVPLRSPMFTGRDAQLLALRDRLCDRRTAVVQAVHGMGGVGKTTLAIEYAHRFAGAYQLVWWIDAEQPTLIGDQLIELGLAAGWLAADAPSAQATTLVRERLRTSTAWLLVFDNADHREDLRPWLPGTGHVLVTSRNPGWQQLAVPVELPQFTRGESVALLRHGLPDLSEDRAGELAERLGDLPLAVTQAAEWMAETGMPVADYLQLLDEETATILSEGKPDGYPAPLAAVIQIAFQRIRQEDPAAAQLLQLCAFLAPEQIPTSLFGRAAGILPAPLDDMFRSPLKIAQSMRWIGRFGLARLGEGTLQLHRLTQKILRDGLDPASRRTCSQMIESVLAEARPDNGENPANWPLWAGLIPHITLLDPATSDNHGFREIARYASSYLLAHGDMAAALSFTEQLHDRWQKNLGPDDPQTLFIGINLSSSYADCGRYTESFLLIQDVHDRRRRLLGKDDPDTLIAANNLAGILGELGQHPQAVTVYRETYERRLRVSGADDPETLRSGGNLSSALRKVGLYEEALLLNQEIHRRQQRVLGADDPQTISSVQTFSTLMCSLGRHAEGIDTFRASYASRVRVLGENHPNTMIAADNLARELDHIGQREESLRLGRETYDRRLRVLGSDHPDIITSASNLALTLRGLGRIREGLSFGRDAYQRARRMLGNDHPITLATGNNLSRLLHANGDRGAALSLARDTYTRCRRALGEAHPETINIGEWTIKSLRAAGKAGQARDLMQQISASRQSEPT